MRTYLTVCCMLAIILTACNSGTEMKRQNEHAPPKLAQYETGRVAFQQMYLSAREWAADAVPFRLQSQYTPAAPVSQGKAGLWRASFASPAKRSMKMFVWSGLVGPDAPEQGISFSAEDSWNPANTSTQPFNFGFLKTDSDTAYDVAEKNGGSKLTANNPNQPVFFVLDWDAAKNQLIWHVIYGSSQDDAKLRIAVDATTGKFLRVER